MARRKWATRRFFDCKPLSRKNSNRPKRKPHFEALEPRILLSSDFVFGAASAFDLTLQLDQDGTQLELLDNHDGAILQSQPLTDVLQVQINGTEGNDKLVIDLTNPALQALNIQVTDPSNTDSDTLEITGTAPDMTWQIDGMNAGSTSTGIVFAGIENLIGAADNEDTFVLSGGSVFSVDGGSGYDTLTGPDYYTTWSITGENSGSVFSEMLFSGIESLQGGAGEDRLVNDAGTAGSVSYDITGAGSGSVTNDLDTIAFSGMESIADTTRASSLAFTFSAADDQITLADGAPNDGGMVLDSPGYGNLTFLVPTDDLTINAGGGDDTVVVNSVDSGFAGSLNLLGGDGTDRVNIDTPLDPVSINQPVDAEVFNDLPAATLELSSESLAEAGGSVTVIATLDRATTNEVTVNLSFAGTAKGSEYTASAGQIVIAAGELSGSITLTSLDDSILELDETIAVQVDSVVNAVENGVQAVTATVLNDDAATLSISDVVVTEGEGATFTVTLDNDVDTGFTIDFATADGSAVAGEDYTALTGTLTFAGVAGEQQSFTINIAGGDVVELTESLTVTLSNPQASGRRVSIADGTGEATIVNNDAATLSISDVVVTEGEGATFTVMLDNDVDTGFTVDFATADGSAVAGEDYTALTGTLTFAGTAGEQQSFTVDITGENVVELAETLAAALSNLQAFGRDVTIADGTGEATIVNDDAATLSISDVVVTEGEGAIFTVTLDNDVDTGVTVDFATSDETALADSDYAALVGTLVFAGTAGETKTFTVNVAGDNLVELTETLMATLANAQADGRAVTIADGEGEATVLNNDSATVSVGDVTLAEGDDGATSFNFTVTLDNPVDALVSVAFATSDGSADVADGDYAPVNTTVVFAPGETSKTVTVQVAGDNWFEADQTFLADLSNLVNSGRNLSLGDGQALGTILNDDAQTLVALDGEGNLVVSDTVQGSKSDTLSISFDDAANEIVITDPNNTVETHIGTQVDANTVRIPSAAISGHVIVDTGGSDDIITLGGDIIPALVEIRGGEGTNTLVGSAGDDVFTITGPDTGTINGQSFTGIQNLSGGSGDDAFVFSGGSVDSVSGGGGSDTLDLSADTQGVVIDLGAGTATCAGMITSIENVVTGAGDDTLVGPAADATWSITGMNAGNVSGVTFANIENLTGAADNEDTFVFEDGGSVSGVFDGGPGGFDSILLEGGTFDTIIFQVTGPDSGSINRDGTLITYAGMEPVTNTGTANAIIYDLTASADQAVLEDAPGANQSRLRSVNGTFETTTFTNPASSLTINLLGGNDVLTIGTLDSNFDADLVINAGDNNDVITINDVTGSGTFTINGNAGDDSITVHSIGAKTVFLNGGTNNDTYLFNNTGGSVGTVNITDPSGDDTVDFANFTGTLTALSSTGATGSDGSVISYAAGTIENIVGAADKVALSTSQINTFLNGLQSLVTWAKALNTYGDFGMPLPVIAGNIEVGVGEALQIAEALDQIRVRVVNYIHDLGTVTTHDILTAISGYVESGIEHLDRAVLGDIKDATIVVGDVFAFKLNLDGLGEVSLNGITGVNTLNGLVSALNAAIAAQQPQLIGKVQAVISEGRVAFQAIDSKFTSLAVTGVGAAIDKLGFKSTAQSILSGVLEGLGNLSVNFGPATLVVNVVGGVPEIELHMAPSASRTTNFAVDLGKEAGNAGIQFNANATLAASASLSANFDLRLRLDTSPSFLLDLNGLNAQLAMNAAVNADLSIGFLGAHVAGNVTMAANPGLTFVPLTLSLAQLNAGNIAALTPTFSHTSNLNLDLDVSLSSALNGLTVPGTANITITSSDLFTGDRDNVAVTFTDLSELFKFDNMNAAGLAGLLGQLSGWLQNMGDGQLSSIDIPLTHANLGDVLDFQDMLSDLLLFDDGDSSLLAKKKLVNDLSDALTAAGLSSQLRVEGDGSKLKLISIDPALSSFSVTASGANWLGFGNQSTLTGTIVASSNATLPPNPLPDAYVGPGNAVLHITINGVTTDVTVAEANLLDNLAVGYNIPKLLYGDNSPTFKTAQEFAARLTSVLASISGLSVPLTYDSTDKTLSFAIEINRTLFNADLPLNFNLDLSPIADLSSNSTLRINANGNLSLTMGVDLEDPAPSTLLTVNTLLTSLNGGDGIDIKTAPSIMGNADVISVIDGSHTYYGRFNTDAVFTVNINGTNTAVTVTGTDTDGTIGIDASTNKTIIDLVVDVNKALRKANLQTLNPDGTIAATSQLRAEFVGNRLLFTAGTGVTSFSITAASDAAGKLGLATGTTASNSRDLLISTQNGVGYYVTLDEALDVGDIIEKIVLATGGSGTIDKTPSVPEGIEGLTFGAVEVAWNDARDGLKIIDKTVDDGNANTVLAVTILNGSQAGLDLRIVGVDGLDDGGDFDHLIKGGQIASVTLADRFYVENAVVSGNLSVSTPGGINASAVFGNFVGVALAGNGSLSASLAMGLKDPGTGTLGGRVTLSELVRGLGDIGTIMELPDFAGSGSFELAVSTTPDISSLIPLSGTPKVDIGITMVNNLPDVVITPQGLDNLFKFDTPTFDFNSILNGLIKLADFLEQFEAFGFLNQDLPLIDMSISDVLDFADRLNTAINEALANPAGTIQTLESKLKEALGLDPSSTAIALSLDGTGGIDVLKLAIDLSAGFSESVNLSIPDINIPVIGEVLDLGGAADFGASGSLNLSLDLGIDLGSPTDVYVYNSTGISGSIAAGGTGLEFMAALGPFGLFIKNGTANINGSISAGLDLNHDGMVDTGGGRILIGDLMGALGSNLAVDVDGGLSINLPTYFPTANASIGAFGLTLPAATDWDSLTASALSSALTLPDFSNIDFSKIGIFDSVMLAVDGLDMFLKGLQDIMDGEVFGLNIPFVGDKLSAAGGFIEDFRQDFIDPLRSFMEAADDFQRDFTNPSENFVSKLIFELLGDPILTGQSWSLDLLKPLAADGAHPDNPDSPVTPNGVEDFIKLDTDGETYIQWNFSIGDIYGVGTEVDMDLGIPGLGIEADGNLGIAFDWDLDLGFGLSLTDGFYLDIGDQNELFANVDITLPSSFTGKLAFLQLRAEDWEVYSDHAGMTNLALAFAVDISNKKDASDQKLSMSEFSNIKFDAGIAAEAVAELRLFLEVNNSLLGLSDSVAAGIPKIQSDFILDWGIGTYVADDLTTLNVNETETSTFVPVSGIGDAIKDGLHYVAFNHVSLDVGSFLSDVLGPIVSEVKKITEPLQPFIDVFTAPLPVLSDLGPPITLLDIAASFGEVDPGLIYSIADVISLINRIPDPSATGALLVDFGDFVIFDARPSTPEGSQILSELWNPGLKTSGAGGLFDNLKGQVSGLDFNQRLNNNSSGDATSKSTMNSLRSGDAGSGFAFPIFDDPSQIFGLLMGQPAVLVTYDMAPLYFEFEWSTFFSIFGPLGVSINIGFNANIDFAFGYDTLGIQEFVEGGFSNPAKLLDGFYVSDTDQPTGAFGVDVPEVVLGGELWAAAELNLGVARAGVGGGIFAEIQFDLFDPNHDGRVRLGELALNFENEVIYGNPGLAPLAIFDVHGEMTAKLFAFLKIDLFFFQIDKTFDITPEITLLEFDLDFARVPVLATELSNGDLVLNMGRFAKDRAVDDPNDGIDMLADIEEHFEVNFTSATHVQVRATNLGADAMKWQEYDVTGKIIAYGDDGDDSIVFSGVASSVGYLIEGGVGDDVITLNALAIGAAVIRGGDGDDEITSGGGADQIWGGRGIDTIDAGGGNDIVFGDDGEITATAIALVKFDDANDIIDGGAGDDIIFGGGGVDIINGGANNDVILGDGGIVILASRAVSDTNRGTVFGNDKLFGGSGNDQIYGGRGDDIMDGGSGSDTLYGEDGNDVLYGGGGGDTLIGSDGNDKLWGLRDPSAGAGNFDASDVTADSGDIIEGNAGNDLIHGNAGDDTIHGNSGADEIYAEDGADTVYGEGGPDLIYGGHGPDIIDGGADDDIIFGDDGEADFAGVYTDEPSPNQVVFGTNLPTGLPEHYDFGTTKSNSYSGTITDMIDTIYSFSGSDFIDGQAGPDVYIIRLQGADNQSFINVYDSGIDVAETDYMQVFGTMYDDNFLLRASASQQGLAFVALLNEAPNAERINYWNLERMLITGSFGDDYFAVDDVRAETTITGDVGEDRFQVGQLYRSPRDAGSPYANVADEDVFATIETTIGWLSDGINRPMTIYGGVGNDYFTVFHNKAVLSLFGEDGDDTFLIKAFALAGSQEPFRDRTDVSGGAGVDLVQYAMNAPVNIDGGDGFDTVIIIGTEFGDDFVITKNGVYGAGLNVNFVNIESLSVDGAEGDDRFYVQSTSEKFITQIFGGLGSDTFNMSGDIPPVISNDLQGHSGVIRHSIETDLSSTIYDETIIAGIAANVYDNDPDAVVVVIEADGNTEIMEGGYTDSYTVVLSKQPTSDVYVQVLAPVQTQDQKERQSKLFRIDSLTKTAFTPDGTAITLKFTSATWDTPQVVTVSALDNADPLLDFNDDALEGDATGFINHVVTSAIGISGTPWSIQTITLADGSKETTLTVLGDLFSTSDLSDDDGLLNLGGYLLLITDGAGAGQSLRIKSVDSATQVTLWGAFRSDYLPDNTSLFKITKDIEAVRAVTVLVHDDDAAGVIIGQTDNSTDLFENGNTDQISVQLARKPIDDVTVTLLSNDGQLSFSDTTLTFDDTNWATPQWVTVTAVNDLLVEGFHHGLISFSVASTPVNTSTGDVDLDVTASETKNLTIAEAYVGLEHRPKDGNVMEVWVENLATSTLELRDPSRYKVISNKVVFLTAGGNDYDFITGNVKVVYQWVKAGYDNLDVKPILTNIADDEVPQVLITETGGATNVIENNNDLTGVPWTDTYNVVLTKAPDGDVYIKVTVDMTKASAGKNIFWNQQVIVSAEDITAPDSTNNADGTVTLKFTTANWNIPQIVSVAADNDSQYDGDDTQYFAPNLHTVSEIQGPLYLFGEGGSGSVVASDPLMLHYELNIMEPTDVVNSVGAAGDTMTVNKSTLLTDARNLNSDISADDAQAIIDLYEKQMTVTIADGVEEIGQFRLIVGAVDNGDGTVTLTLNKPWDLSGGDVAEPYSAITKYAVSRMSPNFFAVEEEQIDYVFVYNEDSPADNIDARAGILQDSTTVGFEGNSIVEAFATRMDGKWLSGLGMGAEDLLIGGYYHPRGITYGDMEVVEINMGDGIDQFDITDTHVRADGYQTWTIINTGRGNDVINATLNSEVQVLASGAVAAASAAGSTTLTADPIFPAHTASGVDLKGFLVKITGGAGVGQQRVITGNTVDTLTVAKAWDVALDATSQFEVLGAELFTGMATAITPETENTLTDANAAFGSDNSLVGRLVEIIDGAGTGAVREIIANTATTLTVSSIWGAELDTTTTYRIYGEQDGPIAISLQEGADEFYGGQSSIPLVVFGGAGADHIEGGSADDILFGDNGRVEYTNESGKIVTLLGLSRELLTPQYLDAWTANTLTDNDGNFPVQTIDMQGLEGFMLSIPDGKGFGQRALIVDNTTDTLTVTPNWEKDLMAVPDGYDPATDFDPINPQNNPSKYRISLIPEDQTDGVTRDPSLIIATDPEIGGNDTIIGNAGNDRIFGGAADDTIDGNAGDDTIFGDLGRLDYTPVEVGGEDGPVRGDFVPATLNRVRTIYDAVGGSDTIHGDAGNDILLGGFNPAGEDNEDTLFGGADSDILAGDNAVLLFVPNLDTPLNPRDVYLDSIESLSRGTGGNDILSGDGGGDILVGGTGNDTLYGDAANAAAGALDGEDLLIGDNALIDFAAGVAGRLNAYDSGVAVIDTTDTEEATGGADIISGNAKTDVILGGVGGDTIYGDAAVEAGFDLADVILADNGLIDFTGGADTDPLTLELIATTDTNLGGVDTVSGNAGDDIIMGGKDGDTIHGNANDDLVIGDFGEIIFEGTATSSSEETYDKVFFNAIARVAEITDNNEGGADTIYGDAGEDILIGGAGSDNIDGGSEDDIIFGDNVKLDRWTGYNDDTNPRYRTLTGNAIYGEEVGINDGETLEDGTPRLIPSLTGTPVWQDWDITLLDHDAATAAASATNKYGDDYLAGGANDDTIFGQLGDDIIQGDGSIVGKINDGSPVNAYRDSENMLHVAASFEAATDGDDYIEGNGGKDVIFGNLGQDDIIGDNSNLFSLDQYAERQPAGADLIFGGAGTDIARNNYGDASVTTNGAGDVLSVITDATGHARDADMILGDNGNIYRLVQVNSNTGETAYLTFVYDNYGTLKIIPRAAEWLDYTPGGPDYDPASAATDIGAADEIHGESGDDFIYGMKGNDVLFGEGQDDDLIGGYGNDWISGGTGDDGILGDDGRIYTSRNNDTVGEPLYGISPLASKDLDAKTNNGDVLGEFIYTPGKIQQSTINVSGQLKKTVNLTPFSVDPEWMANGDEFGDNADKPRNSDDIIYGGLGNDFLHGGAGDDAISGAEALTSLAIDTSLYPSYDKPYGWSNILGYDASATTFAKYDEYHPLAEIAGFLLNFDETEGVLQSGTGTIGATLNVKVYSDGNDAIFGDLGNDWLVGGTGRDHMYGGWGNDLLNADDVLSTNAGANDAPDTHVSYEDIAYGGAGRDVLIGNTGGDRLIDWVGEFNSYLVPFAPFGMATISRTLQPQLPEYLYALSMSDGVDMTRAADESTDSLRNGEPFGELGSVRQKDFAWHEQTGAPRDPQAGNIPGGKRDVLRTATFNVGSTESWVEESGTWAITSGRYYVEPTVLGTDAVSLWNHDQALPNYFEITATVNPVKPIAGYKANAYLIYDYVSANDFKFAGLNSSTNKIEIGQRTADGWIVLNSANMLIKASVDYNLLLAVNGTAVTLMVNNGLTLSYAFVPRVDSYGIAHNLRDGMLGLGGDNAKASIDNVSLQVLPPEIVNIVTDDYASEATITTTQTGTWAIDENGYYIGTPAPDQVMALAGSNVSVGANYLLQLETKVTTEAMGGIIFDQYDVNNFKWAAYSKTTGQILLGHYTERDGWVIDQSVAKTLEGEVSLSVSLKGSTVSVMANGTAILSHVYNAVVTDGTFGLLARGGSAAFDSFTVKTDDPALSVTEPLAALMAASAAPASSETVTAISTIPSELVEAAKAYWRDSVGDEAAVLDTISVAVSDLSSINALLLGDADSRTNVIYIDDDAASYGWFIDMTPEDNSEFLRQGGRGNGKGHDRWSATGKSPAAGHMDLLTVLTHEMGHVLGFDHDASWAVMSEDLAAGTRALPTQVKPGKSVAMTAKEALVFDEGAGVFRDLLHGKLSHQTDRDREYEEDPFWVVEA